MINTISSSATAAATAENGETRSSPPPAEAADRVSFVGQPMQKTLSSVANLANLLPTGTVLAFQTLAPPFSNRGICRISNKCLTASLVAFCSVVCFLSSFTDSFTDSDGKLYYGIATWKGLLVFNAGDVESRVDGDLDLSRFRMRLVDLVHAWVSLLVFLAFALSDVNVQSCFFPKGGADLDVLVMNLPLAAGLFATFFFTLLPTTRRGIGYSDSSTYTYVRPRSTS